jgi:riboflavin kinase/FMN adenylyltransferase
MRIVTGLDNWPLKSAVGSVALGFFDGVHLGHQSIIIDTVKKAQQQSLPSVVLSFAAHPLTVIKPAMAPKVLTPIREKTLLIESLGVDILLLLPFTNSFATLEARVFTHLVLVQKLKAKHITIGYNYDFGYRRQGTPEKLLAWGKELGYNVTIIPPITYDGMIISSSRIRRLISQGEVGKAAAILGRCPTISGKVVRGAGRGHLLGFPTANIDLDADLLKPRFGVYAVRSRYRGKYLYGLANMGLAPTYDDSTVRFEVYYFDFDENLYGEYLRVELMAFLRPEKKFHSSKELIQQMKADKKKAGVIFTYKKFKPDLLAEV